jgi:hypothetical protein
MSDKDLTVIDKTPPPPPAVVSSFSTLAGFELLQRMAKILCNSSMFPEAFSFYTQGKGQDRDKRVPKDEEGKNLALSNSVIALEISQRLEISPLMVAQNLSVIQGKPSWSSTFIIALVNACGRFTPLRFSVVKEEEEKAVPYSYIEWGPGGKQTKTGEVRLKNVVCTAMANDTRTGELLEGPPTSLEMAVKEGWYTKAGSKWMTMPELMLRYRAAAFFGRLYTPDLLMGMRSVEETYDIGDTVIDMDPPAKSAVDKINSKIKKTPPAETSAPEPHLQEGQPNPSSAPPQPQEGKQGEPPPADTQNRQKIDVVAKEKNAINKLATSVAVDRWRMANHERIQRLKPEEAKEIMDHANFVYQALSTEEDREADEMGPGDDQGDNKLDMEV